MEPGDIFAIIISHNGGEGVGELARLLAADVGQVHVVDNQSGPETRATLRTLAAETGVTVDFLPENMGIAGALNRGVARALASGKRWILTMDQDSRPDAGMISAYCRAVREHPERLCLSPRIRDHGTLRPVKRSVLEYAITSGNLVHRSIYDRIGGYRDELFIDGVDLDFSLRARRGGFAIHLVPDAVLGHQVGEARGAAAHLRFYTRHSPLRRYYMFRNLVYLVRHHSCRFPGFIMKLTAAHLILLGLILVHDNNRASSCTWICRGLCDGALGHFGRKDAAGG